MHVLRTARVRLRCQRYMSERVSSRLQRQLRWLHRSVPAADANRDTYCDTNEPARTEHNRNTDKDLSAESAVLQLWWEPVLSGYRLGLWRLRTNRRRGLCEWSRVCGVDPDRSAD
jgi:hypothetical protein